MFQGDQDEIDYNLLGWKIVSVGKRLIEIDLIFEDPLDVSQGDAFDRLFI